MAGHQCHACMDEGVSPAGNPHELPMAIPDQLRGNTVLRMWLPFFLFLLLLYEPVGTPRTADGPGAETTKLLTFALPVVLAAFSARIELPCDQEKARVECYGELIAPETRFYLLGWEWRERTAPEPLGMIARG
ncbi:hypothetical protein MAPG_07388 [Magnaporthiopsis poae ATCC 64411]|uniref:Uncharacterized protein n=1 Tax=Magnaporthiopsis poae (strain ATCC 64411 / 73-15) TaxID=644358 RepID=A0A0C4E4J4_MAGP6|nr:hypothetical protein MAPG_07388 [Magnaporthiopsis poae ATCC 64411]